MKKRGICLEEKLKEVKWLSIKIIGIIYFRVQTEKQMKLIRGVARNQSSWVTKRNYKLNIY